MAPEEILNTARFIALVDAAYVDEQAAIQSVIETIFNIQYLEVAEVDIFISMVSGLSV